MTEPTEISPLHKDAGLLSSSYVLLTAQRILDDFGIKVSEEDLHKIINNHNHGYHLLLKIPFRNVINGIVLQQVMDYQVYLQKLFVDYLLSGSANVAEGGASSDSQANMEELRIKMQDSSTEFEQLQLEHNLCISKSQERLIAWTKKYKDDFEAGLEDLKEIVNTFEDKINNVNEQLKNTRIHFKTLIINTKAAIQLLTEYKFNEEKDQVNMSSLFFDDEL